MLSCAIIGAGQIGSRHLQALAAISRPLKIQVVDPSPDALRVAADRFNAVTEGSDGGISVEYLSSQDALDRTLDLAIFAMSSKYRLQSLQAFQQRCTARHLILEKFLFTSPDEFEAAERIIAKLDARAWVNCHRRVWDIYRELRVYFQDTPLDFRVTGSEWGLGCNCIHFIDLFAYFTRLDAYSIEDASLRMSASKKRRDYVDFEGNISGRTARGDQFTISSDMESGSPVVVQIENDDICCTVNETEQIATIKRRSSGWRTENLSLAIPFVSQTTATACEQLFSDDDCDLATYTTSTYHHLPLLELFLSNYQRHFDSAALQCPIT